ncbi:hypothetical protein [Aurantiacibacter flavus]|uniref:Uncharacterized protein n=1 Tax=Aurantiacibacter flavus TaxID=3145232 RepID=A0ABV0CW08_9SPHN
MAKGSERGWLIVVHEMFHTSCGFDPRTAPIAQIKHEAWVLRCQAAEGGGRHAIEAQEDLYLANEHSLFPLKVLVLF